MERSEHGFLVLLKAEDVALLQITRNALVHIWEENVLFKLFVCYIDFLFEFSSDFHEEKFRAILGGDTNDNFVLRRDRCPFRNKITNFFDTLSLSWKFWVAFF